MAAQTCTFDGAIDDSFTNAGNWNTTVEADRVPIAGDTVVFNDASDCAMGGGAVPAAGDFAGWNMTGYTGDFEFTGSNIEVDGDVILDANSFLHDGTLEVSGDLTILTALPDGFVITLDGDGDVSANVPLNRADLVVNTAGTHTAITDGYWDSFTHGVVGATYNPNNQAHAIAGTIDYDGDGVITPGGTDSWTQTENGNLVWNDATNLCSDLQTAASGKTNTLTGNVRTKKLTLGDGTLTESGARTIVFNPTANDKWIQSAANTLAISTISIRPAGNLTLGFLNASGVANGLNCATNGSITLIGAWNLGTKALKWSSNGLGQIGTLDLSEFSLTCGAIVVGSTSALDLSASIDFGSGVSTIASLAQGNEANLQNSVVTDRAFIKLSGTIDGTLGARVLTWTGGPGRVSGGTIQNLVVTGHRLLALSCVNGGSNSGVNFGLPGSGTQVGTAA